MAWVGKLLATAWVGPGSVVLGGSGLPPPDDEEEVADDSGLAPPGGQRRSGMARRLLAATVPGPLLTATIVILVVPLPLPWGALAALAVFVVGTLLSMMRRRAQ